MKKWIKSNIKSICLYGAIFLILIPTIVYLLSYIPLLPIGGNNDWAGFWGGYLGSVIGAFVAIFVMQQTIENEKTVRKEDRKHEFLSNIMELNAEFAAQINKSNCNLLRFHETGENQWNYEAVYELNEVSKLENILQIKILSLQGHQYDFLEELLNEIIKVGKETHILHQVNVKTFEELKEESDKISEHLSRLMELTAKFIMEN